MMTSENEEPPALHPRSVEIVKANELRRFVDWNRDIFQEGDFITLRYAWYLYKQYADESNASFSMNVALLREELKPYFREFHERIEIDGVVMRNVYRGVLPLSCNIDKENN